MMKSLRRECPTCGGKKVRLVKKDLEFTRQGRKIVVPQVECEECQHCGEVITNYAANQYIDLIVFGQERQRSNESQEHAVLRKHRKR